MTTAEPWTTWGCLASGFTLSRAACIYTDNDGGQIMGTFERKTANGGIGTLAGGLGSSLASPGPANGPFYNSQSADDKLPRGIVGEKAPGNSSRIER
jgi:hypothetical protein